MHVHQDVDTLVFGRVQKGSAAKRLFELPKHEPPLLLVLRLAVRDNQRDKLAAGTGPGHHKVKRGGGEVNAFTPKLETERKRYDNSGGTTN